MKSYKTQQSGFGRRLWVIGTPTYAIRPFSDLVAKWARCSGEEWTVNRLKDLKQIMIHLYAHQPYTPKFCYRKNRKGDFAGVLGSLLRYGLKGRKQFSTVINTFMSYTYWTSECLTEAQKEKFLNAVTATPPEIRRSVLHTLAGTTRHYVHPRSVKRAPLPLVLYRGSHDKWAPTLHYGRMRQDTAIFEDFSLMKHAPVTLHMRRYWPIYKEALKGTYLCESPDDYFFGSTSYLLGNEYDPREIPVGEVHFLQEPGYKLRSIASPYRLFQVVTEPLKLELKEVAQSLPWDCTHDQTKAWPYIQEALRAGKTVYSVDLSSATDYFPLELQRTVLETIFGPDDQHVKLFCELSSGMFQSELGNVHWNRGQPLGFNPSFFAFTVTHGLLLQSLSTKDYDHQFFVVGDDVVILDKTLHDRYTSLLLELGCPYSPDKSIASSVLAEFAGKLCLDNVVVPQLKWRKLSDDNFLDLARLYGPRMRLLMSRKQRRVLDVFAHVPDFIHGMGLNWSKPGSTLQSMIEESLPLAFRESSLSSLVGVSKVVNQNLYSDSPLTREFLDFIDDDYIRKLASTFDEKVASVFRKAWGHAVEAVSFLLFSDIPRAIGNTELPLETPPKGRQSLLDKLKGTYLSAHRPC